MKYNIRSFAMIWANLFIYNYGYKKSITYVTNHSISCQKRYQNNFIKQSKPLQ